MTVVSADLGLAVLAGVGMALGWPAARAMPPTLVSVEALPNAMAMRSIASQSGMVIGPAIGGLLYGVSPEVVYLVSAGCCVLASLTVLAMHPAPAADVAQAAGPTGQPATVSGVLEGLRFVGRTQVLLGAILLDLLAVLFGGAVGLLPLFARSILHVGATGLGVLRAAPAAGALLGAALITHRPIRGRAGRMLLIRTLAPRGVLAIDNVLSHAHELVEFTALIEPEPRLVQTVVPVGAGLRLAVRDAG